MDTSKPSPPRRRRRWSLTRWLFVLIGLNLAWRCLRYGLVFPMWGDEAFVAVNFFHRSFLDMFGALDHSQIVPSGMMVLNLLASKFLGLSEPALRFVPFLAGILAMPLFFRLSFRLLDPRSALMAVAIFAASYYPVRHAAEVKPYSLDLLVSLLILMQAWLIWEKPGSLLRWGLMIPLTGLSVWFSYPVVFIAGGAMMFLTLAVLKNRQPLIMAMWLGAGLLLCISFVGMYHVVGTQQSLSVEGITAGDHWKNAFPPLKEPWLLPLWFLDVHTGNMFAYPMGGKNAGSTATFIMVVFGVLSLWKRNRTLLLLLLSPFPLMLFASALGKYPYGGSARVTQHIAPIVCLLAGTGLVFIFRRFLSPSTSKVALRITLRVMAVLVLLAMSKDINEPYKKRSDLECRQFIRLLADDTNPNDLWIVYGSFDRKPDFPNLLAQGGSAARTRYYLELYKPVPILWSPDPDEIELPPGGRVWLIAYHDNRTDFDEPPYEAYRFRFAQRFGVSESWRHSLQDRNEAIALCVFSPTDAP